MSLTLILCTGVIRIIQAGRLRFEGHCTGDVTGCTSLFLRLRIDVTYKIGCLQSLNDRFRITPRHNYISFKAHILEITTDGLHPKYIKFKTCSVVSTLTTMPSYFQPYSAYPFRRLSFSFFPWQSSKYLPPVRRPMNSGMG